nr:aminopeptidase N [Hydromonas duriensis]
MTKTHLLSEYAPYPFEITSTELLFDLAAELTTVTSWLTFERTSAEPCPMVLDGEHMTLLSVSLDDVVLRQDVDYQVDDSKLMLLHPPTTGVLSIVTTCSPASNTSLSGLFATGVHLMTQCEAEGFRRMTYFPDRPDVLSVYSVTLMANKTQFPVLLANGNLIEQRDLEHGGHLATWHDPFPKPSYLFALVAGLLACLEETIEQDGARKLLQVYVETQDLPKAQFAMDSLKASIVWDKKRFNLPLDLERFMIVATADFNMGAMENKGLNIFNSKFVLAHQDTATDFDFENVEAVVGHEYFHNWTGNRVTCRDWFQLSLKEGLTVYRDQEFSSDQLAAGLNDVAAASARAVKRIDDVSNLRTAQFAEDAGPMAHPIRPVAYEEINNFYTMTVYEKGAEVVRMYETLLGRYGFRKGMDLYVQRHDGQAVTCDDFRAAMADANHVDLSQFARWYEQAGTPTVTASGSYDADAARYTLTLTQHNPAVGIELQQEALLKQPLHIPFNIGLLASSSTHTVKAGEDLPLTLNDTSARTLTLSLTEAKQSFVFENIPCAPIPSLNRQFSAPVLVQFDYSDDDLNFLLQHDSDAFNRWDAAQQLFTRCILNNINTPAAPVFNDTQLSTLEHLLNNHDLSPAYRAQLFTLPSIPYLAQLIARTGRIDPQTLFAAHQRADDALALSFQSTWRTLYAQLNNGQNYVYNGIAAGERALKNLALRKLARVDSQAISLVQAQYDQCDNMTDRIAALSTMVQYHSASASAMLADFYQRYADEALVIDKWFAVQAANGHASHEQQMQTLSELLAHPAFMKANPNRLRALIFTFCNANPHHFHQVDGTGYNFWAEHVLAIDAKNPQVASRLARSLEHWRDYAGPYCSQMQAALQKVANHAALSQDVKEIVGKALA